MDADLVFCSHWQVADSFRFPNWQVGVKPDVVGGQYSGRYRDQRNAPGNGSFGRRNNDAAARPIHSLSTSVQRHIDIGAPCGNEIAIAMRCLKTEVAGGAGKVSG